MGESQEREAQKLGNCYTAASSLVENLWQDIKDIVCQHFLSDLIDLEPFRKSLEAFLVSRFGFSQ